MSEPVLTVYYDGACPLCRAEITHYSQQEGAQAICFLDASHASSNELPADLSREAALARFHVRQADGRLLSGAQGFVAIWETLPRWRFAARLAQLPGALFVLERAYRLFLPLRPFLARTYARARGLKNPR